MRNDFSPKPAYTALRNTIALLEDPGPTFEPGSLDYALIGDTTNVHRTLLQKRDGTFYLVLWQEVASDGASPVAERPLTVDPAMPVGKVTVYRPNFSSAPVNAYAAPDKVNVSVPDYPVILEIEPAADAAPPTITSVAPAAGATDVGLGANVAARFSEQVDPSSVSASTVRLERRTSTGAWVSVLASVAYDPVNSRAVLNPTNGLASARLHRATVTSGVKDEAGNALAAAKVWSFTTR